MALLGAVAVCAIPAALCVLLILWVGWPWGYLPMLVLLLVLVPLWLGSLW